MNSNMDIDLETLWNNTPGVSYCAEADEQRTVLFINKAIKKLTGYSSQEFIKEHSLAGIIHPADRDWVQSEISHAIKHLAPWNIDYRITNSYHNTVWVNEIGRVVINAQDDKKYISALILDINERKKREMYLRISQERFQDISDATGEYLWEINDLFAYTFITERCKNVKGFSKSELIGHSPLEFIPQEDVAKVKETLAIAIENKCSFTIELRNIRDGKTYWERVNGLPLWNSKGEISGFRGAGQSINQMKNAEEALKKAKFKAEEGARTKSEFLAMMSHEIRTPLNGIMGMTQLILNCNIDKEIREFAKIIYSSGDVLLTMINDILDFAKIDAGKVRLVCAPFNLKSSITEVIALLQNMANARNLELRFDYPPPIPESFNGDMLRIRQILLNLISNALKFTFEGYVEVSICSFEIINHKADFIINIKDSGIGIPPEKHDSIFNVFEQADCSLTRGFGGTGLGLTMTRKLLELMDGEISVQSESDRGSTFSVRLQLECTDNSLNIDSLLADTSRSEVDVLKPIKVLLVEDNRVNERVARKILESMNCIVSHEENGLYGFQACIKEEFDIIFMDCQMPEMDGYEATLEWRKIEASENREKTPIIALTARAMDG
ncbi:MAG: PAS domain S-box protein, partial [Lentisphaeraceae bacterium]|nr:PAS domain S-box protein [Lentisphaeraceae bacterium]